MNTRGSLSSLSLSLAAHHPPLQTLLQWGRGAPGKRCLVGGRVYDDNDERGVVVVIVVVVVVISVVVVLVVVIFPIVLLMLQGLVMVADGGGERPVTCEPSR